MKKFEYKIITAALKGMAKMNLDLEATEAILIGLGLEGWELVNTYVYTKTSGMAEHVYVLKREISDQGRDEHTAFGFVE